MKLNFKCCLILCLSIIILFSYLGNLGREGLTDSPSNNDSSYQQNYSDQYNYSSQQQGIPRSQISQGNEDLYILKSEIVPPVCPTCPPVLACGNNKKVQPCPPCARCPEPAFECKKVPNYQSSNTSYLPRPMFNDGTVLDSGTSNPRPRLNDFSQF